MATSSFQQWKLRKELIATKQQVDSRSSSPEYLDADEKVSLNPKMEPLSATASPSRGQNPFDERYLSSEEALSLTDLDGMSDDEDFLDEFYFNDSDAESKKNRRSHESAKISVDMAVAVVITSPGRAKVIQVTSLPTPESSPTPESRPTFSSRTERRREASLAALSGEPQMPSSPVSIPSTTSIYSHSSGKEASRSRLSLFSFRHNSSRHEYSSLFSNAEPFAKQPSTPLPTDEKGESRLRKLNRRMSILGRSTGTKPATEERPSSQSALKRWGSSSSSSPSAKTQARTQAADIPPCPVKIPEQSDMVRSQTWAQPAPATHSLKRKSTMVPNQRRKSFLHWRSN